MPTKQRSDDEFLPIQKNERLFIRVVGNREHRRKKPDRPVSRSYVEIQAPLCAARQVCEMTFTRQPDELPCNYVAIQHPARIVASVIERQRGTRQPLLSGGWAFRF